MAYQTTTYPTTIDVPVNPSASTDTSTFDHAGLETFQNQAIAALEAKVGVVGSAVTTSSDYKLSGITGGDKAVSKTGIETLTNKTLTTPVITTPVITGSVTLSTPTLTTPVINGTITGTTVIPVANGGTGQVTAQAAIDALLPAQAGNSGKFLTNNGTVSSWGIAAQARFGGTGADGALAISSGTTTLDISGAAVFIKNYSSISITGTANLVFINPHANGTVIILKSQGVVTITTSSGSAIDLTGLGAAGGALTTNGAGNAGSASTFYFDTLSHGGAYPAAGVAIASGNRNFYPISATNFQNTRFTTLTPGCGGAGGGAGGTGNGGAGGRGAGALYIQCGGAYTFTTGAINGVGSAGTNGVSGGNMTGGGGGGAGAMILVLYNSLVSNSGTYSVTGGAGGAGTAGANANNGGGGGALLVAGGAGGTSGSAGTSGSSDTGSGGAGNGGTAGGGGGGGGLVLVTQNTEFA